MYSAILRLMDIRKVVGQNVKRIRLEKGLTQEQFSERSGFAQQYLSGIEMGHRNPTIVTIVQLAEALEVSHMDIVRFEE